MRRIVYAALLGACLPATASAQSADEIKNAAQTPQNVLTYGMSYSQQRFSPLDQINRQSVKRLVPVWSYSMDNNTGEESQPLIYDGVMYVTSQNKTVAVDALTGKEIWNTPVEYPPATTRVVCCGIVNRGAAIYQGRIFRTTLDARVIALDAKTGKVIWEVKSGDAKDGIAMTGAPLIADGVLLVGMAGAEYGSRGYIEGYDPDSGKRLWRRYTVPRPGEPGADSWPDHAANGERRQHFLDDRRCSIPTSDLVFWGIGNPAPWNPLLRKGDDLYTNSILAIRPKTGEVAWHYQMSPNDPFDHDNITSIILADMTIDGRPTKVLLQAARNGFFYVLERKTGQLIAANPYVKVTWATGIDKETGRPIWSEATKKVIDLAEEIETWPSIAGGTNWYPYSFDPRTNTAYVNTLAIGMKYQPEPADTIRNLKPGESHRAVKITRLDEPDGMRGYLNAIDPMTGKSKWKIPFKSPNWAGTLVTAGEASSSPAS